MNKRMDNGMRNKKVGFFLFFEKGLEVIYFVHRSEVRKYSQCASKCIRRKEFGIDSEHPLCIVETRGHEIIKGKMGWGE